jgi:hypothetical protein
VFGRSSKLLNRLAVQAQRTLDLAVRAVEEVPTVLYRRERANRATFDRFGRMGGYNRPQTQFVGLYPYERRMLEQYFPPPPGRRLAHGVGGGRELLALVKAGYSMDAYKPSVSLASAASTLIDAPVSVLPLSAQEWAMPPTHLPPIERGTYWHTGYFAHRTEERELRQETAVAEYDLAYREANPLIYAHAVLLPAPEPESRGAFVMGAPICQAKASASLSGSQMKDPALSQATPGPNPQAWVYQELAVEVLRKVVARCDAAGLPFLTVKGAVTSRLFYDDIAERPITDVDVRIRSTDFWRWREIAKNWTERCWSVVWTYRSRAYDFSPVSLDVETDVGPPGLCALTVDAMLSRAERYEITTGVRVLVPEIHDHAVILTVNAFKDRFVVGNPWSITDLERIVGSPSFRIGTFVDLAVRSRIATIAWIVASRLETQYGNVQWAAIRSVIERKAEPRRLYAIAYRRVATSAAGASLPGYLFTTLGGDSILSRTRALGTAVARVGESKLRGWTQTRGVG